MDEILISMINQIFGETFLSDCVDAINLNPLDINGVNDMINTLGDIILPIAAVVLCMHLMIELMDKMSSDSFSSEQFVKLLMKFVFGQIIISNAIEWSFIFMRAGAYFMTDIQGALSITSVGIADVTETVIAMDTMEVIGALVILIIPFLVSFVLRIAVYFMAYSRLLEMIIRSIMSPIGCADVVSGGSHSSGIRYLKRMLGISLQGAMMLILISSASAILAGDGLFSGAASITDVMFLAKYFGVMAAMVGLMGSSKSIAYEVVGA